MFSPRWRKVFRDLSGHKLRTLLVVLSIAVGVFAVSIVLGGRGVLMREFEADYSASNAASAQFYTAGFDDSVLRQVAGSPGVAAADARRRVFLRFTAEENPEESSAGWKTIRLWALPNFDRVQVQRLKREEGAAWPPGEGEVILEASVKRTGDYEIGDVITVELADKTRVPLRVVGFAHDINAIPAQFVSSPTGFISMDTLGMLEEAEEYNHLSVIFADRDLTRTQASRLAADIRDNELERSGVRVGRTEVPKPGSHFLGDIFKAVSLLLLVMAVLAMALSGFLVVTTIQAIVAQQVAQIGIMKAVGGRVSQITAMYLTMVTIYGVMAVALGVPVGAGIGRAFIVYAADILNFRVSSFLWPPYVTTISIAVGLLVPLLAALVPVRVGARTSVVRALNATGLATSFGHSFVDRVLGKIRGLPRPVALSLRNTFLRKGRLVLTLSTLVLASAVVMAVLTVRASTLKTVDDVGAWWNYDALVGMVLPQPGEALEREAEKVPGVTASETWVEAAAAYQRPDGSENEEISAIGLPPQSRFITPRIVEGRWLSAEDEDAVVLNTDVTKAERNIRVGDRITLKIRGDEREYEVVGIASGQLMGPVAFMPRDYLDGVIGADGAATRIMVQTSAHSRQAQEQVATLLEQRLDDAGFAVGSSRTQLADQDQAAEQLGILVTFLVIMAAILASVGVIGLTGTMSINVLESTREIGVMRALGASHGSIFRIFITEGVVIAFMAWAIGAVLSWPLSVWLVDALGTAMSMPLSYAFSPSGVALWLASVLAIAVVASLLPAWRASQVSVRDAIAYE